MFRVIVQSYRKSFKVDIELILFHTITGVVVEAPPTGETVRLVQNRQLGSGRVQVLKNGLWAYVTASSFSDEAAALVCRRLGYKR